MYTKTHHALVDGVSAMRLLQSVLTTDPDKRGMPAPWGADAGSGRSKKPKPDFNLSEVPMTALRGALGITAEAAGMPSALVKTLTKSVRNETSALSLYAPRTHLQPDRSPARDASPPRTGPSSGCARSARPRAPR